MTLISFALVFSYIISALFRLKHSVSFYSFFYLFALFFYSIAPFAQFTSGIVPWGTLRESTFVEINFVLFFYFIAYDLIYLFSFRSKITALPQDTMKCSISDSGALFLLCIALLWGFFFFYLSSFSFRNLLVRGGDEEIERLSILQSLGLIVGSTRILFSGIAAVLLIFSKKKIFKFTALFLLLFFCAPTATPRYFTAAAYVPVMLLIFPFLLKHRYTFNILFSGALLLVFPLLDLFRRRAEEGVTFAPLLQFTSLHFDSYVSFAFVWEQGIITWGRQILGPLLFWFPRSYWEDKPVGSGHWVATQYELFEGGFSNVSMNFLGEGYINFGIFGVFLFIAGLALISKKMDSLFWEKYQGDVHNYFAFYYLYSLAMLIFILRGDLLSSFAYTLGIVAVIYMLNKMIKRFIKTV